MYTGFLWHSPMAAHLGQLSSSSVQSVPSVFNDNFSPLMDPMWKNLVACHISPSTIGHLAWELLLSGDAFGWIAKNRIAFPLIGLKMLPLFVQPDQILLFT